jgi:hypothetical protein
VGTISARGLEWATGINRNAATVKKLDSQSVERMRLIAGILRSVLQVIMVQDSGWVAIGGRKILVVECEVFYVIAKV